MTADVSRTTNYQDDHVASFPWEWLARIFTSEIGFRTAGVGLDRRVANIDCTVAVKTIISQDVSGRWERNVRVNYCTHCSRGTTRKCSRWRGDGASIFAACPSINPVVRVGRVVSGLRLVFGRGWEVFPHPLSFSATLFSPRLPAFRAQS